jgi:hypothetical protein
MEEYLVSCTGHGEWKIDNMDNDGKEARKMEMRTSSFQSNWTVDHVVPRAD